MRATQSTEIGIMYVKQDQHNRRHIDGRNGELDGPKESHNSSFMSPHGYAVTRQDVTRRDDDDVDKTRKKQPNWLEESQCSSSDTRNNKHTDIFFFVDGFQFVLLLSLEFLLAVFDSTPWVESLLLKKTVRRW